MNVFSRTYLKLVTISISFAIIFCFICNMMIESILNSNMNLVCDVYYKQMSVNVQSYISLLKSANEYLASNEIVVKYLTEKDKDEKYMEEERKKVLEEVIKIEENFNAISFINSINIVDLENKYLFAQGRETKDFDITTRPWYDEKFFTSNTDTSQITKKHMDYSRGNETISIISLIYNEKHTNSNRYPIGAAILDIYVKDLLNYIDSSFYPGVLKTEIYGENIYTEDIEAIEEFANNYNVYANRDILNNGEYLVFKFNKPLLISTSITTEAIERMKHSLWIVGITISILLFVTIKLCFSSALMSIKKLKLILGKLNNKSHFVDNKNEFRQLEILADMLNKSFDEKIQELIYYDELTGLPNRKMLEYKCEQLISENKEFALIFIDLNKFKHINDIFGHVVGDEYLIKFSTIVNEIVKDKGMLTRYSGDEFILIYEKYIDNEELLHFYDENLAKIFLKPIQINPEITTEIGFSAGVATYPKDGKTFEELINKSDLMMYINKKKATNRKIKFFDEEMYSSIVYSEKVKTELKLALENNEFYLNYQPIIDKEHNILKAEALLRWNNKNLGFIPPDKFIKYLEETRQIIQVGYWIIENVCENIKDLKYNDNSVEISINISPLQLMLNDFVYNVKSILKKYNVDYKFICFEVTENVLLENKEIVFQNIKELRELGIKIALDDFGTGYSSFNYLRSYNIDILKIDKSFLKENEKLDFNIINQIKELAHLLDMKVVMEGVETEEQFNVMKDIDIDYIQGYYFSKPLSLEEFKKLLEG